MSDNNGRLFMIRARTRVDRLFDFGKRRQLPLRDVDEGYLVHSFFRELFAESAPQPFVVNANRGRYVTILGYSKAPADVLRDHAQCFADPSLYATMEWDYFVSKPMPHKWSAGKQLSFEVRTCPVVRMAKGGIDHRKGAEVDVFLAECWKTGDKRISVDREVTYKQWFEQRLPPESGAQIVRLAVHRFQIERLLRPHHAKSNNKKKVVQRPDVTFWGSLEVIDGEKFVSLLRRGIGRHRAFGFGMLLLSPEKPLA